MMKEKAIVTGREGSQVVIEMQRQGVCSHCELNNGCGTGAIGRLLGHRSKPLKIPSKGNLRPGDEIILGIQERAYLSASLIIYGLPLLGLISGGLLSQWVFGESDFNAFAGSVVGLTLCLISSNRIARYQFSQQFNPEILQVNAEPKG